MCVLLYRCGFFNGLFWFIRFSKFSVIDTSGGFYMMEMDDSQSIIGSALRKDIWGMQWAGDNPQLIAVMEKARLYVLRGTEPEEPLPAHGYLCQFQV